MIGEYIFITNDFLQKLSVNLSWEDMWYGYENGYLSALVVVNYNFSKLEKEDINNESVINLAGLGKNELYKVRDVLYELVKDKKVDTSKIKRKWMFILLFWLYDNKERISDMPMKLELLYSDFDYSVEIAPLIGYMPAGDATIENMSLAETWNYTLESNKNVIRK